MKLLIAADIFPPETGGPATYSVHLADALTKDGWSVEIVSLNPDSDKHAANCRTYAVASKNKVRRYLQYVWLLFKRAKDTDVIYAMGPVNAGLPALIAGKLRGKKVVVKVVGDYAWEQGVQRFEVPDLIDPFQNKSAYRWPVRILKWIESFVVSRVDRVITPSNYLAGIVAGWGASKDRISVVYNTVDFQDVYPAEKPDGEQWIVSVGRLVPWKGMDTLIDMMADMTKALPNVRLKIIGGGPILELLRRRVIDKRLEHYVDVLGALPREEALSYISAADVFVLNSAYEGLSHVLLEARYLGARTLASDAGGNSELLDDSQLFPYNDAAAIEQKIRATLLEKEETVESFSAERFTFAYMISRTKDILQSV